LWWHWPFYVCPAELLRNASGTTTFLKNFKNYVLNLVNFSKFEGIPRPSWIWLLFFGAWFQLFGLFWMVTGLPIIRLLAITQNAQESK
jgi:hypothetical protein